MPLLSWHDIYSVGNDELDSHHKKLFDILNMLYDTCFKNNDSFTIVSIKNELSDYTYYHFSAEEQYMRDIGYSNIDEHVREHHYFTDKMTQLKQLNIEMDSDSIKGLIVFLGNWLMNHVLGNDKQYSIQQ